MLHRRPGHLGAAKRQLPDLNTAVNVEGHGPVRPTDNDQPVAVNHGRTADIVQIERLPRRGGQAGHGVGPQHAAGIGRQCEYLTARVGSIDHPTSNSRRGRPENRGQAFTALVLPELLPRRQIVGGNRIVDGCREHPAIVDRRSTVQGRGQPTLPDNITVGGLEADQAARSRPGEQDVVAVSQTTPKNALALGRRHERLSPADTPVAEAQGGDLQLAVHGEDHTIDHDRGRGNAVGPAIATPDGRPPPGLGPLGQRKVVDGVGGNGAGLFPAAQVLGWRQRDGHVRPRDGSVFIAEKIDPGPGQARVLVIERAQHFAAHEQGGQCQHCGGNQNLHA